MALTTVSGDSVAAGEGARGGRRDGESGNGGWKFEDCGGWRLEEL